MPTIDIILQQTNETAAIHSISSLVPHVSVALPEASATTGRSLPAKRSSSEVTRFGAIASAPPVPSYPLTQFLYSPTTLL
ncbi:hypothetical protein TsFJ059_006526 [Trichoderma semiorbis]|uniref:Uncharacterized protein n=1 Tax=Trichoderma semiorbis TaxID=1491008 RepID=A0A9P8KQB7_9HYPO|nr:hypothetical protein TsFJ059_006526 [Trichoderma semiorbis]